MAADLNGLQGNPEISKAKWTEEEDARLAALVKEYGSSWAHISRQLPGRTDQQCMVGGLYSFSAFGNQS